MQPSEPKRPVMSLDQAKALLKPIDAESARQVIALGGVAVGWVLNDTTLVRVIAEQQIDHYTEAARLIRSQGAEIVTEVLRDATV